MSEIICKTLSAMEKILPDREPTLVETNGMTLKNEPFHFQLAFCCKEHHDRGEFGLQLKVEGELKDCVTLAKESLVPSYVTSTNADDYYLEKGACLIPDPLKPITPMGLNLPVGRWMGVWVSVRLPKNVKAGTYQMKFMLTTFQGEPLKELNYTLEVLNAELPETDLCLTNWMHYDGIARQHGVELFSDEFYQVFASYLKLYVDGGFNMLLTPIFTPPLDTNHHIYRKKAQLVDVKKTEDGYEFTFEKLKKFIEFVTARGVKYIEFSHLFTQWGAEFCPQIWANVNGEEKRIFGWDVQSSDPEYVKFLEQFFARLGEFLREEELLGKCYFHLTDEPNEDQIEAYARCCESVKKHIGDMPIMDALHSYSFYQKKLVDIPVVSIGAYQNFEQHDVPNLFVYNCCGPAGEYYSNRFMNMPNQRTRVLGVQLYQTGVQGYLHWGYNFYNSWLSFEPVNPYEDTTAGGVFPAGDCFIVYPYENGAIPSVRHAVVQMGFNDYRALKLLESLIGKEKVDGLLQEWGLNGYTVYPREPEAMDSLRRKINLLIQENID